MNIIIQGYIKRKCEYCGEEKELIVGIEKKSRKPFKLCKECIKELYEVEL